MKVVAVIPARGGSKGIPRKNLAEVNGRPLIAYSVEAALSAQAMDHVIVSTDDEEIATVSRSLGAEVPFLRPASLSDDVAPMLAVLRHTLEWCESRMDVEAIVLLQPTSPLRTCRHIDESMALFRSQSLTSVVSVVEVPHNFNPVSVMKLSDDGMLQSFLESSQQIARRQDKPVVYARNGPAVLVCSPVTIHQGELYGARCMPYIMTAQDSLDIDTLEDLKLAEEILSGRRV
ncbi:MAG TPA: N-acylneuraminate cytidylyltransferase [Leptospiraceae bacterium]|nr:N-acylneuraminate cytidylyltransferase [Spirochaetaceae bacterium]HBS04743.1 N-acylneuraminate cytidylyltransferase [Leptospiraceae bacterium]|tara:strand:- start:233 stop:928 length:696 start_codon:yes stop_codon:yes gene_type:complete